MKETQAGFLSRWIIRPQAQTAQPFERPGAAGEASKMLEFEYAAVLRDQIIELRGQKQPLSFGGGKKKREKRETI